MLLLLHRKIENFLLSQFCHAEIGAQHSGAACGVAKTLSACGQGGRGMEEGGTGKPSCSNCSCLMKSQEVKFYGSHKS